MFILGIATTEVVLFTDCIPHMDLCTAQFASIKAAKMLVMWYSTQTQGTYHRQTGPLAVSSSEQQHQKDEQE